MACKEVDFFQIWKEEFVDHVGDAFSLDEILEQVGLAAAALFGAASAVPAIAGFVQGFIQGVGSAVDAATVQSRNRSGKVSMRWDVF